MLGGTCAPAAPGGVRGAVGAAALAAALLTGPAHAADQNPPTIKDLEQQQVDVNKEPPKNIDAGKTMDSYRRFLDLNAGDAALRAEALRRLGDLNLESSESERIERELVTNEGLRATEAIHLYSALLKTYPKYERNDSVLYQLARAYELNAQPDKALATLDQLVASYPHSHYMDEAQFRRGELLFSNKAYPQAQTAYEAVIKIGPSSAFYSQSLYKHGWSLFKQGESERSLESFSGVLDSVLVSKSDPKALVEIDSLSKPNRELVEDTFRVMSITFSYNDGAKSIDEFVKHRKQQRPYYYLLYARLGDLYMEKFIERPRHIEFQILADQYGNVVSLGERECSIQRRHQKLLEESPSTQVSPELRDEIGKVLSKTLSEIGYVNAGTIEFLMDEDRRLYFIEMNTRIQVEHPVTEMVTDVDLVKSQILLAAGERMETVLLGPIVHRGHAIECRINAEHPEKFTPSAGKITAFNPPGGTGVRIDTAAYAEGVIPPYYDSLIAKLIVRGKDRSEAVSRMARALEMFIVEGIFTTIPLHRRILADPDFRAGKFDTTFIERFLAKNGKSTGK